MHIHHHHETSLVVLSIVIAIFASYTALDLVNCISISKGKSKWVWLTGGSMAMGVGIWSMHFIGMLAFKLPGIDIYYDVPLMLLSILVAIVASALALYLVSTREPRALIYLVGSLVMGAAISGMHYIGIASMRLAAVITWDYVYVFLSILVAIGASYLALFAAFKLRDDVSIRGFLYRGLGGVLLGMAIAGMHYTAMYAMSFNMVESSPILPNELLATDGMASAIIIATLIILGIALSGSNVDRALTKKTLMNEILQHGIQTRDEFVSVASHELRTPLTSIKLQIALAMRQMVTPGPEHDLVTATLKKADKNIDQLNRLVEDILDISRLSAGKLKLEKETFNLSELVTDIVERFHSLLIEAGCTVHYQPPLSIIGYWDRFRLEQVIVNLLSNAARYAPGKPIFIKITAEKKIASISIRDQGKGIATEDQERIFQRFERIEEKNIKKGLGLGLFIVKEIIEMHGGEIVIKSKINEGAEFIIQLPLEA